LRATPKVSVSTARNDTVIETAIQVRKPSRVTAYTAAFKNSHSGCVNDCTRSTTFQRRPWPFTKLSAVRAVIYQSSDIHAVTRSV
jgi:hypothetical protein